MSDGPTFESIEGLAGTGKSTIAPLLAKARGAVLVPSIPDLFQEMRAQVDAADNVEARMCFYLSALFVAAEQIAGHLHAGDSVVVESYFPRCLVTHRAMGARLTVQLPDGLPRPTAYYLVCTEPERQRRLAERFRPATRWDALAEQVADRIGLGYSRYPMTAIDTSTWSPSEVVRCILSGNPAGGGQHAA